MTWARADAPCRGFPQRPWLGTQVARKTPPLQPLAPTAWLGSCAWCPLGLEGGGAGGGGLSPEPGTAHLFSLRFALNLFTCISPVCPFPSTSLAVLFLRVWAGTRAEQVQPNQTEVYLPFSATITAYLLAPTPLSPRRMDPVFTLWASQQRERERERERRRVAG